MAYINIETIKKHLNIESDFTEDDGYLSILEDVAEETVAKHICSNLSDLEDGNGNIPMPIHHAILLYIGDLYNSREGNAYGVSVTQIPFSYDYLLSLYKNYSDTTSNKFVSTTIDDFLKYIKLDEQGNCVIELDREINNIAAQRILHSFRFDEGGNLIAG